jgi:copper chaperone CopZ
MMVSNLHVTGMVCDGCVNSVRKVLEKIPGVFTSKVELATGEVEIQHSVECDIDLLISRLGMAGFPATHWSTTT